MSDFLPQPSFDAPYADSQIWFQSLDGPECAEKARKTNGFERRDLSFAAHISDGVSGLSGKIGASQIKNWIFLRFLSSL
jgi:hypothetical protein